MHFPFQAEGNTISLNSERSVQFWNQNVPGGFSVRIQYNNGLEFKLEFGNLQEILEKRIYAGLQRTCQKRDLVTAGVV